MTTDTSTASTPAAADPSHWGADVLASFVVFLVALPLCMGISIASGMPPTAGLMAGLAAGFVTLVIAPLAGSLSDRIGRRPVAGVSYLMIALLIYPAFLVINASPTLGTLLSVVAPLGRVPRK